MDREVEAMIDFQKCEDDAGYEDGKLLRMEWELGRGIKGQEEQVSKMQQRISSAGGLEETATLG